MRRIRGRIARKREHEGGDAVVETLDEDFLDEGFVARARDVDESDDEGAEDEDDETHRRVRENIFGFSGRMVQSQREFALKRGDVVRVDARHQV